MSAPFDGIPCLRRTEGALPARAWNLWRRWRARFGDVLEFPFAERPGTAVVLNDYFWLFADVTQGGMPLILWLDFETEGRSALHADIPCAVQYYDYPGARFHEAVLKAAVARMEDDLKRMDAGRGAGT